jgi:hypothetical protein
MRTRGLLVSLGLAVMAPAGVARGQSSTPAGDGAAVASALAAASIDPTSVRAPALGPALPGVVSRRALDRTPASADDSDRPCRPRTHALA